MSGAPVHHHQLRPEPNPTLVVCGSIHYDVVLRLPRLPQGNDRLPVSEATLAPGGMGGNVAAAFTRLGGRARFAGHFSRDDDGDALRSDLLREGVDLRWAQAQPAGAAHRGWILVGVDGERAILGMWQELSSLERAPGQAPGLARQADVEKRWRRHLDGAALDPAVFTPPVAACYCPVAYAPHVLPAVPAGLPVFMDLETGHVAAWNDDEVVRVLTRTTVTFGNDQNLARLAERFAAPSVVALADRLGIVLVETVGAGGCIVHAEGECAAIAGYSVAAVDTTGAGDCFAAAFSLALLRGASLTGSARFANAAAALSTRRLGSRPGVPDAAELAAFLSRETDSWGGREMESAAVGPRTLLAG